MGTEIELKVGEWYETNAGDRVKVIADTREHEVDNDANIVALFQKGFCRQYNSVGVWTAGVDNKFDITKHLQGCTGWDWQEPKWRPAKAADLDPGIPVDCRVKDKADACWTTGKQFVGYNVRSRLRYRTHEGGSYEFCEVLDAPAVPPSAEPLTTAEEK